MLGEGEWKTQKHGAGTLDIRAIEVTSNRVGDAQVLPDLLNRIPCNERIDSVCADGAYDTKRVYTAIAEREAEAMPIVVISKAKKSSPATKQALPRLCPRP